MRKYDLISALSAETSKEVARNEESWKKYLNTASRLYKYPFKDQLLIYAQRPDATACASIEIWNDKMHCWVNKGAKGIVNILALQYPDSGKLSTDVPDVDTGIDWLVYLARYSQQCQAQSHFVVRSRLDIVENTEIMVGPNQSFYCGTLRPDCRPFRTGIFRLH